MSSISNILELFVDEFKEQYLIKEKVYEKNLVGDIKKIKDLLLDEDFVPSVQLEQILNKQIRRARYPMEVAITGQFSSGKSTFLNALLSKNILPTGITPVTSKVNFINYGEEYKLKITYHSGAQEFHSIDSISTFTDQREKTIDDIKYLTIYAPMDILKDITFVDTPGLNSQSASDTQTTKNVLRDVGGIIWLTLIDNAGKMSEMEILDEYMPYFKTKSLCVLNQKDKFDEEQIKTTTSYIKDKFSKYFTQVTPISAKMALDARALEKTILIENSLESLLKEFKDNLKENIDAKSLDFFAYNFNKFQKDLHTIKTSDIQKNLKLLEESNIQEVLDFIQNVMRPNAIHAKEYAIKKDLKAICDILIKEYNTIIAVYDSLNNLLIEVKDPILEIFTNINRSFTNEQYSIYNNIQTILEQTANEIFNNINLEKNHRFEISKNILNQEKIQKFTYDTYTINADLIFKSLYYDDQIVEKKIKRVVKQFKNLEKNIKIEYENVYLNIENDIYSWKEQYQLLRKNREIASDLEFAKVRRFASQTYENILKSYHVAILGNMAAFDKKSAYFNALLSHNHQQIIDATIAHFQRQIQESEELYKKEPSKFSIQKPRLDDILEKLKEKFSFEKVDEFLISKKNYLSKIIKYSKNEFIQINEDKIKYVKNEQLQYKEKIKKLQEIKNSI